MSQAALNLKSETTKIKPTIEGNTNEWKKQLGHPNGKSEEKPP